VLLADVMPILERERSAIPVIFRDWHDVNFRHTLQERMIAATAARPKSEATLILIFDQFEEYFRYNPDANSPFDAELALVVNNQRVDMNVVFSMRRALSRARRRQRGDRRVRQRDQPLLAARRAAHPRGGLLSVRPLQPQQANDLAGAAATYTLIATAYRSSSNPRAADRYYKKAREVQDRQKALVPKSPKNQ